MSLNQPNYSITHAIDDFATILSSVSMGLLLGIYVVSHFVFKPYYEKVINEDFTAEYEAIPYAFTNQLKNNDYCEFNIKGKKFLPKRTAKEQDNINENTYMLEITPSGTVIMKYDKSSEAFIYWSNRNITFKFLDVVARRFVNSFCCWELYKPNNFYDVEHLIHTIDDDDKDAKDNDNDNDNDKNDKDENDNNDEIKEDDKNDVFIKRKPKKSKSKYNNNNDDVKRNKFIKKGTLSEFSFLQNYPNSYKEKKQNLSFSSYKKTR